MLLQNDSKRQTVTNMNTHLSLVLRDASYSFLHTHLPSSQVLSKEDVHRVRAENLMWTADFKYPLLPWSSIVLEAVPEQATHAMKYEA